MASFAFRAVCLLLVALALCQDAVAADEPEMTPGQMIRGAFVEITGLSDDLRIECAKISDPVGGFLILTTKIAPGFAQITFKVSAAATMLTTKPPPPLEDADAEIVVAALTAFVRVHQALLAVVIGKSGLLARIPILSPIREALVQLEKAVDAFAFVLIGLIPTRADDADAQFASLRVTVKEAEVAYEPPLGLNLPSVGLPKVGP